MTFSRPQSKTESDVVKKASDILREYFICDYCLGRLFARHMSLTLYQPLGQKLRKCVTDGAAHHALRVRRRSQAHATCYICKGLFDLMPDLLHMMRDKSAEYEFSSFAVGATIKSSIMDRDDHIRSAYKMQGADGVKTGLTKELGRRFAKLTGGRQEPHEPEVVLTVQPSEQYCEMRSKPVVVFGRYIKHSRGVPQKQGACDSCMGRGCYLCEFHGISGYDSVEGQIAKFLFGMFGGTTARFTWIGGEDRDSLVSGGGRPFFARIQFPKKRRIRPPRQTDKIRLESISIHSLSTAGVSDVKPMSFSSKVRIRISMTSVPYDGRHDEDDAGGADAGGADIGNFITDENAATTGTNSIKNDADKSPIPTLQEMEKPSFLRGLKRLANSTIEVRVKNNRVVKKTVADLRYRRETETGSVVVQATLEGGIPIKRFVTGDGVWPSISQILGVACKCTQFDFEDVIVQ